MMDQQNQETVVIVGAGPVGTTAALYAAHRGYRVQVYELRPDLREPTTIPLNFTRSINLALSERGICALRGIQFPGLVDDVLSHSIPMRGRMVHRLRSDNGEQEALSQDYDIHGRAIHAVDRAGLNSTLLNALDAMDNVEVFFGHKLTGADFIRRKAWFESIPNSGTGSNASQKRAEIEVSFDFMIGADGAHSAVRYHMMKFTRMDYQQQYIDTLWCEFKIHPAQDATGDLDRPEGSRFIISPNHLHIWPAGDSMFIAIPSMDGSFTCTLFLPSGQFANLEQNADQVPNFFDERFPGVTDLISRESLVESFTTNPHLPLISLRCKPFHFQDSAIIIGDAAHAMVPFYGQGMNAGLEDVRILFEFLDAQKSAQVNDDDGKGLTSKQRALALEKYTAFRVPDAHAINDLALDNYVEMRSSVLSPIYRLRKLAEELIFLYCPGLGWQTKYSRVSFGNERYSEVIAKSEEQGRVLLAVAACTIGSSITGLLWLCGRRYFHR